MSAHLRGAHAPSRAGDDALVAAKLFFDGDSTFLYEHCVGEGAERSTRGACAPGNHIA